MSHNSGGGCGEGASQTNSIDSVDMFQDNVEFLKWHFKFLHSGEDLTCKILYG